MTPLHVRITDGDETNDIELVDGAHVVIAVHPTRLSTYARGRLIEGTNFAARVTDPRDHQ